MDPGTANSTPKVILNITPSGAPEFVSSPAQGSQAVSPLNLSALRRHFEISLYFLLLTGVVTLLSTGKLDLFTMVLTPLALIFKGYRWAHGKGPEVTNRAATWLTVGYFVFFPFDLWVVSRVLAAGAQNPALYAALLATIHLMLFAIVVRLYSALTTRDYMFLTLMAFTSMLAAAILTVDTVFLAFFLVFLGLAVSTFVGLEMWRSAQGTVTQPVENGTRAASRLHHALGITSGSIALGALGIGAVIFMFLPRLTGGYMSGFNLRPTLISGFSDDVELGEIGEIKKNSAVVMRISVDGGLEAARGIHWRGVALTKFDGRRWYNDLHDPTTLTPAAEGWFHFYPGDRPRRASRPIHYTVLLEPIASSALFFANEAAGVRGRFNGESGGGPYQRRYFLLQDSTGSVFNPNHNFARMQYEARSDLPRVPVAALRLAGTTYAPNIRDIYLQLPKLDPRIPQLAQQITARGTTPFDKAQILEGYLRSHYGYTLDLSGPPQTDPLAYFLFQKRAGHCEYFAAAMTVMLRSIGIPARYINGFLTGEYNDVGGDFVVRASDAHSWVEVYFPSYGWTTFDPTPPSDEKSPGMFASMARYWDWFELQWSEWVINYDFGHQAALAQGLQRASRDWTERVRAAFTNARRSATDTVLRWQAHAVSSATMLRRVFATLVMVCIFVVLLRPAVRQRIAALWHLRIAAPSTMTPHIATLHYNEMLRLLARRGLRKADAQTPLEFAASVGDVPLAESVHEMTYLYHSARFGAQAPDPKLASSLLETIAGLLRSDARRHPLARTPENS